MVVGGLWLSAFSCEKSEDFQLRQFGDFNMVSRQAVSEEKTDLSKPISTVQRPVVDVLSFRVPLTKN